jgi:hypothetical protein
MGRFPSVDPEVHRGHPTPTKKSSDVNLTVRKRDFLMMFGLLRQPSDYLTEI